MRYYIADCHFFHERMNSAMDMRGFLTVDEMNQRMIRQWNKRIRDKDEVFILGDFCYGGADNANQILDQLHGKLYLIRGNHDKWLNKPGANLERFEWIKDYAEIGDGKKKVILCHYPICEYNGMYRSDNDGTPHTYMLYGHIHDSPSNEYIKFYQDFVKTMKRPATLKDPYPTQPSICMINCFCCFSDYMPLTLEEWARYAETGDWHKPKDQGQKKKEKSKGKSQKTDAKA